MVAVIIIAVGGKGQRLGDLVAGTTVVKLVEQQEISSGELFMTAQDNYVPVFSQDIHLSSRDIELMRRALEAEENLGNSEPLERLFEKVKLQLGIQTELAPDQLVRTLIKDHSHLSQGNMGM